MPDSNMNGHSPAELILARSRAFSRGDFGFIYDSYHSASNFRRQFTDRDEYIHFGRTSLGRDFAIIDCQVIAESVETRESRVIFLMEMNAGGQVLNFAELAWLRREAGGWRYHRGQKITAEELPEDPQKLKFSDFAKLDPATIF